MDKWDVLKQLESTAVNQQALRYFCAVWNTDDERTFEEWRDGAVPHDHDGNPLEDAPE
jgi:hypothetical protein